MSSFLVFLCKSKFFPTCICPFTYVDISSTSLWHLSEEPFQSPLPTLDFLSWPSSYFFSFSREILYQHLQHNCQLTFVVMSVKCFWWGVACVCFPSGWSLSVWAQDWEPWSRSSQLGFFTEQKMISLLQFIDVFCGNGIHILEHLWQLSG